MDIGRRSVLASTGLLLLGSGTASATTDTTDTEESYPPGGVTVVDPAGGAEALQSALDASGSDPGTVVLSGGVLEVETNVVIPSNTWLRGVGRGTVIKLADGTSLDVAGVVRIPDGAADIRLSDFVIDGNRENVTNQGKEYGLFTKHADRITCERVITRDCPGYGFDPHAGNEWETTTGLRLLHCGAFNNGKDGITLAGVEESVVGSCLTSNNDRHGVNVTDSDCRCITVGNTVSVGNGGNGIVVQNSPRFVAVANNQVTKNARAGIKLATTDQPATHCTVTGNVVRRNDRYGLSVLRGHNVAVVGNSFRANALAGGNAECKLDAGDGWGAHECLLAANSIHVTAASYGIDERVTDGEPNVLLGNIVSGEAGVAVNRGNPETVAAFNTGTSFRRSGTVTVGETARRAGLPEPDADGAVSPGDVQATPAGPLGAANSYWVERTDGACEVVLDAEPGQSVPFTYVVDTR